MKRSKFRKHLVGWAICSFAVLCLGLAGLLSPFLFWLSFILFHFPGYYVLPESFYGSLLLSCPIWGGVLYALLSSLLPTGWWRRISMHESYHGKPPSNDY